METIRYEGRAIVVTGGGRGIGEAYARELAARGASVVVNEIDAEVGEELVGEIVAAGGVAVANSFDVSDREQAVAVIDQALTSFGRVDGLICNAGFLRDKTFHKVTLDDFESIVNIHLMGAVYPAHAAWPHMREQRFGRLVFTTSTSALWGNFGQSNYDAAKLAVVGLMNALKLEGKDYGICVNTIAPLARTRLAADLLSTQSEKLSPAQVAGLVCYLCSDACTSSGDIFDIGGAVISKVQYLRTAGLVGDWSSPEAVSLAIRKLEDSGFEHSYWDAGRAIDDMISLLPG